jgi:hypothetical protein
MISGDMSVRRIFRGKRTLSASSRDLWADRHLSSMAGLDIIFRNGRG